MSRDLNKEISVVSSVAPAAALTATTTGAAVDLAGYRSAAVVVHAGVATDGTFVPTVEESDASGSGFTTVAAADLSGSFADIVAAADENVQEVGYLGSKRYIRVVLTESVAATSGAFITATVVRGNPRTAPV
jgi:hypothetical protein